MTKALSATLLVAAPNLADAASACAASGARTDAYPRFCDIPAVPKDVRSPQAFHAAVLETRLAGRNLTREIDSAGFQLQEGEADSFKDSAITAVTPPGPAEPTVSPADSDAFAAAARRAAAAPPRRKP